MRAPRAAGLLVLALLGGCTLPFNWFGRRPPPPTPAPTSWETDTAAGAEALAAGNLDEAERRLEMARERAASGTGNDLAVAASLSNLAIVRRAQGDTSGALAVQQEALSIRERALGPNHPDVAATLNSIGGLYAASDDYAAAEPPLTRALAIREQALGADHRSTAQSLNNLALLYAAEGRYAEAEPLYQRAIAIFEHQKGSADLATALDNYAALLDETGRTDEARQAEARARMLRQTEAENTPNASK